MFEYQRFTSGYFLTFIILSSIPLLTGIADVVGTSLDTSSDTQDASVIIWTLINMVGGIAGLVAYIMMFIYMFKIRDNFKAMSLKLPNPLIHLIVIPIASFIGLAILILAIIIFSTTSNMAPSITLILGLGLVVAWGITIIMIIFKFHRAYLRAIKDYFNLNFSAGLFAVICSFIPLANSYNICFWQQHINEGLRLNAQRQSSPPPNNYNYQVPQQ